MKAPIYARWFRRLLFQWPRQLGFVISFPGSTPKAARAWLKAHGYAYRHRQWERADRKPSRMTPAQRDAHIKRMVARRRRERAA